jgi:hypothetical protein
MLDAHPDLAIPPETHFIPDAVDASAGPDARGGFLRALVRNPRWGDHRVDEGELRRRVEAIEPFDVGEALRAFYGIYAERFSKPRWGDKTPKYCRSMGVVGGALPEARFVHLIRDGRDVALSASRRASKSPRDVRWWAGRWRSLIEGAREAAGGLGGAYMELRYEDLVSDPEAALGRVCAFVDLPWDPAMLLYHERAAERICEIGRDLPTRSGEERVASHALTASPPLASKIAAWKEEMAPEQVEGFERVAGAMLDGLGYERATRA